MAPLATIVSTHGMGCRLFIEMFLEIQGLWDDEGNSSQVPSLENAIAPVPDIHI